MYLQGWPIHVAGAAAALGAPQQRLQLVAQALARCSHLRTCLLLRAPGGVELACSGMQQLWGA